MDNEAEREAGERPASLSLILADRVADDSLVLVNYQTMALKRINKVS